MITSPLLPFVDAPVPITMAPDEPELVVPVWKDKRPETPVEPALTDLNINEPLVVVVPRPLEIETAPPVPPDDEPPDATNEPPCPLVELLPKPAVMVTPPPCEDDAVVSPLII